jgi:hypothetical protein
MSLQSQAEVTVSVIDWPDLLTVTPSKNTGRWDKRTGGKGTSNNTKYRGADGKEESLGGQASTEDLVISRLFKIPRDSDLLGAIYACRGILPVTVSEPRYDKNGNRAAKPIVWTGIATEVDPGDYDSTSDDARLVVITVSPDSSVSA